MRITSLSLEQFRNYSTLSLDLSGEPLQLFIGENGSGKTNIIEAMSLLSLTKSCRGKEDGEMVQWDQDFFRVKAEIVTDEEEKKTVEMTSVLFPRKKKAFFVNDVHTPVSQFVGVLPSVTFLPQDLQLFSGSPGGRRRYLDQLLSQVSPEYLQTLSHYQKLVSQRNALLKRISKGEQPRDVLSVWDAELAAKAAYITAVRLELIEMLNLSFADELSGLGEAWDDAHLHYNRKSEERDRDALQSEILALLEAHHDRDIILHSTTIGPHRDDWQIVRGDLPIQSFASRGQERVAMLALLFLEASYIELRRKERPVILLDDALSELDDPHREALLHFFSDHQVILTGTHLPPKMPKAKRWNVIDGQVRNDQ